jgi:phosphopantothenoylcysteine decarboxylase/phosphopantothenate--cysteine ligase
MSSIKGKKILLGITGSIAAYKSAFLTRLLIKEGCEVKVIMTESAKGFITPLSLSTLSKHPVLSDILDEESWNNHVELGLWADAMLIAPATANTLAKMRNGLADNLLVASYLSAKCPVFIAPAMDLDMWIHGSTKDNLNKLESYGNHVIPVEHGELASGLVGDGRMAEPEHIISYLSSFFGKKKDLISKTVLVTAGPTQEKIDPVRFIGNRSSGKMGIALANEFASRGAKVSLVLGPVSLKAPHPNIISYPVKDAEEMYQKCTELFSDQDISVMAAAVADYTPANPSDQKIKKQDGNLSIELVRTKDIAASLGKLKRKDQLFIGFALETNNEMVHAQQKLKKKNFDFIVLNSLKDKNAGFQHDTNKITIIHKNNKSKEYPLKEKTKVAEDIVNEIIELLK